MSNLNPAVLQVMAQALADTVPDWAGRKFNPLLSWWQESTPEGHGNDIVLLGSDGRKVRFNPEQVKQIAPDDACTSTAVTSVEKKAAVVVELPTSPVLHGDASPHVSHGSTSAITPGTDVSHRVPVGEAGSPVPGTSQGEKPASSTRYSRVSSTRYSRVKPGRKPNPPASHPSPVLHGGKAGK